MKKLVLLSVSCAALSAVFSQSSKNVKLLYDNPVPYIQVHVVPLEVDLYSPNFNFGYGLRGSAWLNKRFSAEVKLYTSWFTDASKQSYNVAPAELKEKTNLFELNGRFHFADKSIDKDLAFTVSQSRAPASGKKVKVTTRYFTALCYVRKYKSLRFGLNRLSSPVIINGSKMSNGKTTYSIDAKESLFLNKDYVENVVSFMHLNYFNVGISTINIKNSKVKHDRYKRPFRVKKTSELFFDLFFGKPNFDNVYYDAEKTLPAEETNWKITPDKIANMGWRVGWNMVNGITNANIEMGSRPGIAAKGQRFFLQMGLGFTIGVGAKEQRN